MVPNEPPHPPFQHRASIGPVDDVDDDDMPPPHPIDRTRLTRYVTSRNVRCALSGSYSSNLNPRNLEPDYYPAYNHMLAALVDFEFEGAITVAQQFNIWLSKATFDLYKVKNYWIVDDDSYEKDNSEVDAQLGAEDDAEGMDVDEEEADVLMDDIRPMSSSPPREPMSDRQKRNAKPPLRDPEEFLVSAEARAALMKTELTQEEVKRALKNYDIRENLAKNPADATEADTSIQTIATVHDPKAKDSFPDMLLCHWYAVDVDMPDNPDDVFGWERRGRCKIRHQCFPLIMEIKGCPSRSLRGEELEEKKAKHLDLAAGELYTYVQLYFTRDVHAKHVIAMIACGPYWQWRLVARSEIHIGTGIEDHKSLTHNNILLKAAFTDNLLKTPSFVLATEASDEELTRLRDEFLIPLIEDHHRYPSTAVPNPQPEKKKGKEGKEGRHGGHEEDEEDEENGGNEDNDDNEDEEEEEEDGEDYDDDDDDEEF